MLTDVVVDTNVWMNANDPKTKMFPSAFLFVAQLLSANTRICLDAKAVDNEGKPIESKILGEYTVKVLQQGPSTGANALAYMLANSRWRRVNPKTTDYARKWAEDKIRKPSDRPFLIAAINSRSKVLVSNDEKDFDGGTRQAAKSEFKVTVAFSDEGCTLLQSEA
jgi:hypothetical protein